MNGILLAIVLSTLCLLPAGRALAVSWGAYGEWSTGSQTFDFFQGVELKDAFAIPDSVFVPQTSVDQSQWGIGAIMDTNVAKDTLFGYRLALGYERGTKKANSSTVVANSPVVFGIVTSNGFAIDNIFAFGVLRRERFKLWLGPAIRLGFRANQFPALGKDYEFYGGGGVRAGVNYHVNDRISLSLALAYTYVGSIGEMPIGNLSATYESSPFTQYGNMIGINAAVLFRGAGDQFIR